MLGAVVGSQSLRRQNGGQGAAKPSALSKWGSKWLKIGSKCLKMVASEPPKPAARGAAKAFGAVEMGVKMAQNGSKWLKMGPKWLKMAE